MYGIFLLYYKTTMGWLKKIGKKIAGPFKRSSKVRIITSAVVGGAIGFCVGGPAGAAAGAIYCGGTSIEHGGALVIGAKIPLGPSGSSSNSSPDPTPDPTPTPTPEVTNDPVPEPEEKTTGQKVLEWIGKVLQGGADLQERMDQLTFNPGPRFEIDPADPPELAMLKARANNLTEDIEKNCGNYSDTHRPMNDIITGRELQSTLKAIEDYEKNHPKTKKIVCPSCGGSRRVSVPYSTPCTNHIEFCCSHCSNTGQIQQLQTNPCTNCGGTGVVEY